MVVSVSAVAALGAGAASASAARCVSHSKQRCFHSIRAAVKHAPNGAVILVAPGRYSGQVTISGKHLTLRGAGRRTIVEAKGHKNGFLVKGRATRGTTIEGFEVQHADNEGILVLGTSRITIRRNRVEHNDRAIKVQPNGEATCPGAAPFEQDDCGEGLHLDGVARSRVIANLVNRNVGGILITDESKPNHDNLIARNRVTNNKRDCGITLPSHPAGFGPNGPLPGHGVYNNVVRDNVTTGNAGSGVGIFAPTPGTASFGNLVIGNRIARNGLGGVALHSHSPQQNLSGNAIIGNSISANAADDSVGPGGTGGPVGIVVFNDASQGAFPILGMTIAGNRIGREAVDIWLGKGDVRAAIHNNNLLGGHAVGVRNAGASPIDATQNWWGCPGGPGNQYCSSVQGAVTFSPVLTAPVPTSKLS